MIKIGHLNMDTYYYLIQDLIWSSPFVLIVSFKAKEILGPYIAFSVLFPLPLLIWNQFLSLCVQDSDVFEAYRCKTHAQGL